jgi:hypothetical protein
MTTILVPRVPHVRKTSLSKLRPKKASNSGTSSKKIKKSPAKKITVKFKPIKTTPAKTNSKAIHQGEEKYLLKGSRRILIFSSECLQRKAKLRAAAFHQALQQLDEYQSAIPYAIYRFMNSNERGGKA